MLQGLQYPLSQVMPQVTATVGWPSLCTIQSPDTAQGPTGNPVGTYSNVAGLVNIPCRDSVPSTARIQATELKELADIMSKGLRHMLLNGYYPQATPDGQIPSYWRANVDGVIFDIIGVEHDSQNIQTRLEMQVVSI